MADKNQVTLQVRGEDPLQVYPPFYSNFVAISRVAGEVQFEFIFLDLNQLALMLASQREQKNESVEMTGKTVAKIVIPAASFLQLREHINRVLTDIEREMTAQKPQGDLDVRSSASS